VIAAKAANVFFIPGLLCVHGVRPRDRRTTQDTKKPIPRRGMSIPGGPSYQVN
jgi:hypothetical protein